MTQPNRNVFWALVISIAFATTISSALLTRVDDIDDTPMAVEEKGAQVSPVPLLETAGPPPPVYVIWLRPDHLLDFLRYPELRVHILAIDGSAHLTTATIEVLGTDCRYETRSGAGLDNGSLIRFVQGSKCYPLVGNPTGDLKLSVRLADRHRIGVGAFAPIAPGTDQRPASIRVIGAPDNATGPFPVLRGYYVEYLAPTYTRRVDLLAYMWQIQPATWIWQVLGLACGLLFVGAAVTPHNQRSDDSKLWLFAFRASVGTGCAAAALGVLYAVIVPPFQAPDEPTHFLGFAAGTGRSHVVEEAQDWSRRTHFERLRFHSDERFRPSDVARPLEHRWQELPLPNPDVRGINTPIWLLVGRTLPLISAFHTLLVLRLLNAFVFAMAVALGTAAIVVLTDVRFPQLAAFPFVFVPTVPFFATHVSNHALLTSAYVLFASAVVVTAFAGRRGAAGGLLLGVSAALTLALSRSAMPMAAMLAIVLMGRLLIGEQGVSTTREALKRALIFWSAFSAAMATMPALLETRYIDYLSSLVHSQSPQMAAAYLWGLSYLPWLVAFGAVAAIILDTGLFRIRRSLASKGAGATFTRAAGVSGAAVIGASMLVSLVVDYPTLRNVDLQNPPDTQGYLAEALFSALGIFRLKRLDFFTSTSFWAGFGWLDAIPPDGFIVTLTTMTALASITGLVHLSVRPRQLAWLATIAVGWAVTFVLYAFITLKFSPNLHGRYLLGLYFVALSFCWSVLLLKPSAASSTPVSRWTLFLAISLVTHAYSLNLLLRRYF